MVSAPVPSATVGPFMAAGPKDLVTTGLGAGQVWATIGQGILNEVYWPTTGEPQIRRSCWPPNLMILAPRLPALPKP
jgi:Glucodextranase, domain N